MKDWLKMMGIAIAAILIPAGIPAIVSKILGVSENTASFFVIAILGFIIIWLRNELMRTKDTLKITEDQRSMYINLEHIALKERDYLKKYFKNYYVTQYEHDEKISREAEYEEYSKKVRGENKETDWSHLSY